MSKSYISKIVKEMTRDLKSLGHCDRTGSSPVTGTMKRSIVVRQ